MQFNQSISDLPSTLKEIKLHSDYAGHIDENIKSKIIWFG